jgi:hypothetical protein
LKGYAVILKKFVHPAVGWTNQSQDKTRCPRVEEGGKNFIYLLDTHWTNTVGHVTDRRIRLRHLNKPELLPTKDDVVALTDWTQAELAHCLTIQSPSSQEWRWVAYLVMVRLILFNKQRVSEVDELKILDFTDRPKEKESAEVLEHLDVSERALVKR